jgi:gluconokinase
VLEISESTVMSDTLALKHSTARSPPLVLVMGVSGSGKSTVGELLARRLGTPFVDADSLHPAANLAKMTAGLPLTDADRAPWLDLVAAQIAAWGRAQSGGVIACSALKRAYRARLAAPGLQTIYLQEAPETVRARLNQRQGHFMPAALVDSQFEALEVPTADEGVLAIPQSSSPEARADAAYAALTEPAVVKAPPGQPL